MAILISVAGTVSAGSGHDALPDAASQLTWSPCLEAADATGLAQQSTQWQLASRARHMFGGCRMSTMPWIVGVDGCPAGWIAAFAPADEISDPLIRVVARFADIVDAPERPAIMVVDMPIGLPDRINGPGRTPERMVRPLLGLRQSSVFSIPAREAVLAASYTEACEAAAALSEPPRKISKQGFMIFPKIREIDALLRDRPDLTARIFESHPEVAFVMMQGGQALTEPKKIKGKPWPDGMALRQRLLAGQGINPAAMQGKPPRGAAADDQLDALACLITARAIVKGQAQSFPSPPERDAHDIPIAIWAPRTHKHTLPRQE